MENYTFGSYEFMESIATERLRTGENFPMTLNDNDFRVLTTILRDLALYGECTRSTRVEVAKILGEETGETEPVEDWAWNMLSSIAETLGVEGI